MRTIQSAAIDRFISRGFALVAGFHSCLQSLKSFEFLLGSEVNHKEKIYCVKSLLDLVKLTLINQVEFLVFHLSSVLTHFCY